VCVEGEILIEQEIKVLQCVAVCCSVLNIVAVCCSYRRAMDEATSHLMFVNMYLSAFVHLS